MMGIKKVVAGSRNRKREKKMNATTQAKTRNVYVRDIMMPVIFCKDCKYYRDNVGECEYVWEHQGVIVDVLEDDFCSKGERK